MTVYSVYAPTLTNSEESVMAFNKELRTANTKIPEADKILFLGDFNVTRLGRHLENMALKK